MGVKDILVPRLGAFIRAHGSSQTRIWHHSLALRPAFMRPQGHGREGTGTRLFATCGQPSAMMVPRKGREGCVPRRKADGRGGRSIPGNDGEGAALRGSRQAMCPHRRADRAEGSSDPRRRPRPWRSSTRSSTERLHSIAPMSDLLRGRRASPSDVKDVCHQVKGRGLRGNGPAYAAEGPAR